MTAKNLYPRDSDPNRMYRDKVTGHDRLPEDNDVIDGENIVGRDPDINNQARILQEARAAGDSGGDGSASGSTE